MAKRKVVTFGEYVAKVKGENRTDRVKQALKKLYQENKVIDKFEDKGEVYFIVEG